MKKLIITSIFAVLPLVSGAAMPFVGLYQTIDDETNAPKSIVALYEYPEEPGDDDLCLAGRIVALYGPDGTISETLANPTRIADKVSGSPKMVGMDILWNMEWDSDDAQYEDGKIMDPKSGKIYSSVAWQDSPEYLNVRGKIGPFGRTQRWNVVDSSVLPVELQNIDTTGWVPFIRRK